jgi:hypothetical protein
MSVKINSMSGATFTTNIDGITEATTDLSTSASTTAFVKTFLSNCFILLNAVVTIATTLTFSTIYLSILKGVSSLTLRGNLSIGKSSIPVSLLGNNINLTNDYPALLTSTSLVGSKIQVGTRPTGPVGVEIVTAIPPVTGSFAYANAVTPFTIGVSGTTATGFLIKGQNSRGTWIMFS